MRYFLYFIFLLFASQSYGANMLDNLFKTDEKWVSQVDEKWSSENDEKLHRFNLPHQTRFYFNKDGTFSCITTPQGSNFEFESTGRYSYDSRKGVVTLKIVEEKSINPLGKKVNKPKIVKDEVIIKINKVTEKTVDIDNKVILERVKSPH